MSKRLTDKEKETLYQGILVEFDLKDSPENRDYFEEAVTNAEYWELEDYIGHEIRDNFLDYSGLGQYT
jgi:hypothetical protein